jgi:hypothetical protein
MYTFVLGRCSIIRILLFWVAVLSYAYFCSGWLFYHTHSFVLGGCSIICILLFWVAVLSYTFFCSEWLFYHMHSFVLGGCSIICILLFWVVVLSYAFFCSGWLFCHMHTLTRWNSLSMRYKDIRTKNTHCSAAVYSQVLANIITLTICAWCHLPMYGKFGKWSYRTIPAVFFNLNEKTKITFTSIWIVVEELDYFRLVKSHSFPRTNKQESIPFAKCSYFYNAMTYELWSAAILHVYCTCIARAVTELSLKLQQNKFQFNGLCCRPVFNIIRYCFHLQSVEDLRKE